MKRTVTCEVCSRRKTGRTCLMCDKPVCQLCAWGRPCYSNADLRKSRSGPSNGLEGLPWNERVCSRACAKRFKRERREDRETMLTEREEFP